MRRIIKEQISLRRPLGVADDVDRDDRQILVAAEPLNPNLDRRLQRVAFQDGLGWRQRGSGPCLLGRSSRQSLVATDLVVPVPMGFETLLHFLDRTEQQRDALPELEGPEPALRLSVELGRVDLAFYKSSWSSV